MIMAFESATKSVCYPAAGPLRGLLLLPLLLLMVPARAQSPPTSRPLVVKLTPQYLLVSGYWLEAERRLNRHPRQSLALTAQLYAGAPGQPDVNTSDFEATQRALARENVRGAGLLLQHRLYLSSAAKAAAAPHPAGLYFSYGPQVQRFVLSRDERAWQQVRPPDGGPPYYEYGRYRRREIIVRFGALAQVGYQVPLAQGRVVLDVYAGAGRRASRSREAGAPVPSRYDTGPSDYGHQGWFFPAGFKLGLAL